MSSRRVKCVGAPTARLLAIAGSPRLPDCPSFTNCTLEYTDRARLARILPAFMPTSTSTVVLLVYVVIVIDLDLSKYE